MEEESRARSIGIGKSSSDQKLPSRYQQSNKRKAFDPVVQEPSRGDDEDSSETPKPASLPKPIEGHKKRKPSSFLDEVLAGKARKKGKKKLQVSNT